MRAVISPDGKRVAFNVQRAQAQKNANLSEVWVASAVESLPPKRLPSPHGFAMFLWSADSTGLVYLRQDGSGSKLWSFDVETFQEAPLMPVPLHPPGHSYSCFRWSADGRALAYLVQPRPPAKDAEPVTAVEADVRWDARELPRLLPVSPPASQLWWMDLESGQARQLSDPAFDVATFDWSPDGGAIAFVARCASRARATSDGVVPPEPDLYLVEVPSGIVRELASSVIASGVSWSPDNEWIAYRCAEGLMVRAVPADRDMVSPGDTTAWCVLPHHCVGAVKTNRSEREYIQVLERPQWSPDGRHVYVCGMAALRISTFRISVADGTVEDVFPEDGCYWHPSYSRDGSQFALMKESVTQPPRVYVGAITDFVLRELVGDDPLNPHLSDVVMPSWERITWRSKDDRWDIHGFLLKPPDYQPGRKYPLIVGIVGGPSPVLPEFNLDRQYPVLPMASQGYLVLYPHTRGRGGFGPAFAKALHEEGSYVANAFQFDVMAGVDRLVEMGMADPDRVGIMGFSYGGTLAGHGITQTHRFQAASISEGACDLLHILFDYWADPSMRRGFQEELHSIGNVYDPVERARVESETPLYGVQSVQTPALLEYGMLSMAATHGRRMFHGLQYFGVPSELLVYPRSGHSWAEPLLVLDSYNRNLVWFDYWLRDKAHPDKRKEAAYNRWKRQRTAAGQKRRSP